ERFLPQGICVGVELGQPDESATRAGKLAGGLVEQLLSLAAVVLQHSLGEVVPELRPALGVVEVVLAGAEDGGDRFGRYTHQGASGEGSGGAALGAEAKGPEQRAALVRALAVD